MFDVGFSELIVIGIVALVVIGPERLPKVARTAGVVLGRLQRYVQNVKADISREMQLDELKKLQAEMQESARNFEQSVAGEVQKIEKGVDEAIDSARDGLSDIEKQQTIAELPKAAPELGAVKGDDSVVSANKGS